ncbi:MAG TPA: hypothetical protein VI320_16870 [Terracidiphilus sp.]|jgi:hypothetical protein
MWARSFAWLTHRIASSLLCLLILLAGNVRTLQAQAATSITTISPSTPAITFAGNGTPGSLCVGSSQDYVFG